MRTLSYTELPRTNDPRQVFTVDVTVDGAPLHARIELRYLPAPDRWVISLWDNASSELLVNRIPLVCSRGDLNDLFLPFRHLRDGAGVGSLFVLRNTDSPSPEDPARGSLADFQLLYGDTLQPDDPAA